MFSMTLRTPCAVSGYIQHTAMSFIDSHQLLDLFPRWSQSVCGVFLTGGLAEEVDEKVLHAAFIPFGDLVDIQIPLDYETGETLVVCRTPT